MVDCTWTQILSEHYHIVQTITGKQSRVVELQRNCEENLCTAATNLNKKATVCVIQWEESMLSRRDNTSVPTEKIREWLSLKKVEEEFVLEVLHIRTVGVQYRRN